LENLDTGAGLRERVACALRLSPQRVTLVKESGDFVQDEEIVGPDTGERLTVMVGEGQELAEWCECNLAAAGYSVREVPGVGALPEGSKELKSPKVLGKVLMLAIKRARKRGLTTLRGRLASRWMKLLEEGLEDEEEDVDMPKDVRDKFEECCAPASKAGFAFFNLDARLHGPCQTCLYSRWEEHKGPRGDLKQHRVYGIRQAFSAVEMDQLLGHWIEERGSLDRAAVQHFRHAWRDDVGSTQRNVERQVKAEHLCSVFNRWSDVLVKGSEGEQEAAWVTPHAQAVFSELLRGFERETYLWRDSSGCAASEAKAVTTAAVDAMCRAGKVVEGGSGKVLDAIVAMTDDRHDELVLHGMELLTTYFRSEEPAIEAIRLRANYGWPHIRRKATAVLAAMTTPTEDELVRDDVPGPLERLPSPRTLLTDSLRASRIVPKKERCRERRKRGRMGRHRKREEPILYSSGSEYDESEEE